MLFLGLSGEGSPDRYDGLLRSLPLPAWPPPCLLPNGQIRMGRRGVAGDAKRGLAGKALTGKVSGGYPTASRAPHTHYAGKEFWHRNVVMGPKSLSSWVEGGWG